METVWTSERIAHFWDMVANEPRLHELYFAQQQGDCIVRFAKLAGLTGGNVLDYGCGAGCLSKELVEWGFETEAVEFSDASVERVDALLRGASHWHGCHAAEAVPTALDAGKYDFIFSVENYEHLLDEWIPGYFQELRRLLKPGGKLLLTTPNEENLDHSLIICPCCEAKFHRWGHLRTTTASQLADVAGAYGFNVEFCRGINLRALRRPHPPQRPPAPAGLAARIMRRLLRVVGIRLPKSHASTTDWQLNSIPDGPHLVLVAS